MAIRAALRQIGVQIDSQMIDRVRDVLWVQIADDGFPFAVGRAAGGNLSPVAFPLGHFTCDIFHRRVTLHEHMQRWPVAFVAETEPIPHVLPDRDRPR